MLFYFLFQIIFSAHAQTNITVSELQKIHSPRIVGSTLYITGKVDSHIYDFLSYAEQDLKNITWVSLNSLGGNHDWAMTIAQKLQSFRLKTLIEPGSVCASSCVYLFMAGQERWMNETAWLGVHGARLGLQHRLEFYEKCVGIVQTSSTLSKDCEDILAAWYDASYQATQKAFLWIQSQGASPQLFHLYLSFDDVENWLQEGNVLRKPDWVIPAKDALKLSLATHIFQVTPAF